MAESELVEAEFSYTLLEKDNAAKLRYCAGEIQKLKVTVATSIMEIGKMLTVAQEELANYHKGLFVKWIESECGFSKSSAYNYMAAFHVFGNCATVAQLEDAAMYALVQKDVPEKALKEALKLADKGIKITQKQAKDLIKKHKELESEQEVEEEDEEKIEDEPEIEEEPTVEETCEADNKAIESFCRAMVKQFEQDVPRLPWTEDSGRIDSALQSLKAGLTTLRGGKSVVCPACVDGMTVKGKCRSCKGHGYLPVYKANAIPQDERL